MAARAATSAVKAHIPTLRRAFVNPNLSVQSTNCSLQHRIPVDHNHFIIKREEEAEEALQTGEVFVKQLVFEKLKVSTKKGLNDEPIFFAHSCDPTNGGGILTAFSLGDDGNVSPIHDISPPFPLDWNSACWGICNGVVSFSDSRKYALWNPKTNEVKIIPWPPSLAEVYPPGVEIIFASNHIWFDDKSQDYKVIQISNLLFDDLRINSRCVIDLYSVRTDSWKKFSFPKSIFVHMPCACINGVFYANAYKDSSRVILSFDLSTKAFSCLPIPPHHNDNYPPLYFFLDYNGLFSILSYSTFRTAADAFYEHWVMRNGSWDRLSVFQTRNVDRPLGFSRNGESLFFISKQKLLVFDSSTGKMKHADGIDSSTHHLFALLPFSESSVKLTGGSYFEEDEKEEEEEEDGHMIVTTNGPLNNSKHDLVF